MSSSNTQVMKKSRMSSEANDDDKDYISKLPESVMCHILSLLPSKESVQTSVLSKDWVNKWTSIYDIDIDDRDARNAMTSFVKFMDKILNLSHNLKSFSLSCTEKYDSSVMTGWISAVSKRVIESFQLQIHDEEGFVLPYCLLNNNSLIHLSLKCTFKVNRENGFPNLTCLNLDEVEIQNGHPRFKDGQLDNSDRLVFTFPVLRELVLRRCNWSNAMEIRSPKLNLFKCESSLRLDSDVCLLKICGAKLVVFEYSGDYLVNVDLDQSFVYRARLLNTLMHRTQNNGLRAQHLLKGFTRMTSLELSFWMCEVLSDVRPLLLPRFDRLQRLVMCVDRKAELLHELLHSAPLLKFLVIDLISPTFVCPKKVYPVPYCVAYHLKDVTFRGRADIKHVIYFAMYMLRSGRALKNISIIDKYHSRDEILKRLSKSRRASKGVSVTFS